MPCLRAFNGHLSIVTYLQCEVAASIFTLHSSKLESCEYTSGKTRNLPVYTASQRPPITKLYTYSHFKTCASFSVFLNGFTKRERSTSTSKGGPKVLARIPIYILTGEDIIEHRDRIIRTYILGHMYMADDADQTSHKE